MNPYNKDITMSSVVGLKMNVVVIISQSTPQNPFAH